MRKIFSVLLSISLILLPVSSAYGANSNYSTISIVEPTVKSSPIYIVGPYDENSNTGYVKYTDTNGDYYARVRETKLVKGPADSDPVVNYQRFGIVYRTDNFTGTLNETVSLSHSVSTTVSNTSSVSVSLGIKFSKIFSSNISTSHSKTVSKTVGDTVTKTYSKGFSYSFPSINAPANCTKAERGVGFQFQTYRSLIDVKKLVSTLKYVNITSKRHVNRCSICNQENDGPRLPIPGHFHDDFVGYIFTLADGTIEEVDDYVLDDLIRMGTITSDMRKFKKSVMEWKKDVVVGEVKLPVNVMTTTYFDKDGNILDENGNIVTN